MSPFGLYAAYICTAMIFMSKLFMYYIITTLFGKEFYHLANCFLVFECASMLVIFVIELYIQGHIPELKCLEKYVVIAGEHNDDNVSQISLL